MNNRVATIGRSLRPLAIAFLAITPSCVFAAQSLNQAVNDQLRTVDKPCDDLLGADRGELVLTGGLQEICSRFIAAGSVSQASGPSAGNTNSLSSGAQAILQGARGDGAAAEAVIGNWSLFANLEQEALDGDATALADAFDSSATRINAGVNYRLNSSSQLGVALVSKSHEGDYQQGGNFSSDSLGVRVIADINLGDAVFLQFLAGRDGTDTDRNRAARFTDVTTSGAYLANVTAKPNSSFSYDETEAAAVIGTQWTLGATTLTPSLGINWQEIDFGTHSETGVSGLEVTTYDDTSESLQAVLGLQASWAVSSDWGVWAPQIGGRLINEFENQSRQVQVSFTGDKRAKRFSYDTEEGDSNYVALSAGSVFLMQNGWQFYFNAESYLALDNYTRTVVSGGLRLEL